MPCCGTSLDTRMRKCLHPGNYFNTFPDDMTVTQFYSFNNYKGPESRIRPGYFSGPTVNVKIKTC